MTVSVFAVNKNPSDHDLRAFGRAMWLGFGILGALLWVVHAYRADVPSYFTWRGSAPQVTSVCFWGLGVALCILSYASSAVSKPIYVVWMTVAAAIGTVMSTIMLTVLFFVLVPIFSIIVRRGDPLRKKLHAGGTYWEPYPAHEPTMERLKRPF